MEYANATTQHLFVNKMHWVKPEMGGNRWIENSLMTKNV